MFNTPPPNYWNGNNLVIPPMQQPTLHPSTPLPFGTSPLFGSPAAAPEGGINLPGGAAAGILGLGAAGALLSPQGREALAKIPGLGGLLGNNLPSAGALGLGNAIAAGGGFTMNPATGRLVRAGSGLAETLAPPTTFGGGFSAALKPGLANVGGSILAGIPSLLQGDIPGAIGSGGGAYLGSAAGAGASAALGATGLLGNFIIPGVGGILGAAAGKALAGKFGDSAPSPRFGAANTNSVVQQANEAGQTYALTPADMAQLENLRRYSGSLAASRQAIMADLPNIHGGGTTSEAQSHLRNLILINAFERDNQAPVAGGLLGAGAPTYPVGYGGEDVTDYNSYGIG